MWITYVNKSLRVWTQQRQPCLTTVAWHWDEAASFLLEAWCTPWCASLLDPRLCGLFYIRGQVPMICKNIPLTHNCLNTGQQHATFKRWFASVYQWDTRDICCLSSMEESTVGTRPQGPLPPRTLVIPNKHKGIQSSWPISLQAVAWRW